jgi:spore germination protein
VEENVKKFPILILFLAAISGCTPGTKILEDIQLIQAVGYDEMNGEEFKITAGATYIPPGQNTEPRNLVFTSVGKTTKQIRQQIKTNSAKPIETGRVGVVLFQQEVAKNGIERHIDNYQRDANIGRDIHLVTTQGSTEEILRTRYTEGDSVSQHIIDVVDQNMDHTIPDSNLHDFLSQYYAKGYDPFMPYVSKDEDQLKVLGVALYKKDKLVDTLSLKESYILKLLYEPIRKGQFETEWKDGRYISTENLHSHTDYKIKKERGRYHVQLTIHYNGEVSESGGMDLTKEKNIKKMEREVSKAIEKKAQKLVEKFIALGVDPIGLGERARQQKLYDKNWEENYADLSVDVKSKVKITQGGIIE